MKEIVIIIDENYSLAGIDTITEEHKSQIM